MNGPPVGSAIVHREDRGPVRILWLNRPEKRNAIDMDLRLLLAEELESAMSDPAVRSIILTGASGTFCSGGDISTMKRMPPDTSEPRAQAAQRVIRAIWSGPTPVIAAVEDAAYGAGISLALACDLVVAAEDARFNTAFMGVGLAGDMGVFGSLPARVGRQAAKRMMLVPRVLSGVEATQLGLADEATPSGTSLEVALARADAMAAAPPLALRALKRLLGIDAGILDREVAEQVVLFDTEDFAEGIDAFHSKRRPDFRGH